MRPTRLALLGLAVLCPAVLLASSLTITNTFSDGTVASAAQVNKNFTDVKTAVDDNHARLSTLETRRTWVYTNTSAYSTGTGWAAGPTFPNITGFRAGSLVKLTYHLPMRNDSSGWGGGYIEPQISFNGGSSWNSLGSSGYDAGVMNSGSSDIGSYFNTILVDPGQSATYSVQVRFYFRAYDGTVRINEDHDINNVSGTAPIMAGVNGNQHYAKIIVEEVR